MGKPGSRTPIQVFVLILASSLTMEPFAARHEKDNYCRSAMPIQGNAFITIEMGSLIY